ncbi:MAG: methyltransferase domain-containing protein [Nitrospirae bacterium]|nr:methyltransferase domain-containing protein [Nitrospirota bacterium]
MSALKEAGELRKLWGGFWASRVLLTANNYRIFDYLIKPQSAKAIAKKLKTNLRATEILLDAITGIRLLKKNRGKYSNAPISAKFLVRGSAYYHGDILRHADSLWQNWSELDKTIKTGKPIRKAHDHEAFIMGMHNIASLKVKSVIKAIGAGGAKTALDLGGGPGTYSIEMAKKGIDVTLFDRPETVKIARRVVKKEGIKNINFIEGDFIHDNIGKGYDLIFASQIMHSLSEKDNLYLLKKCKRALNKLGRIVIQEFRLLKDRAHPPQGALFSVNMLVNTEGGRSYSTDEIKNWLSKTGFRKIEEKLIGEAVIIQAFNL